MEDLNNLNNYTISALREKLRSRGLLTEGNKATLISRLQNMLGHQLMNQPNPAEFLANVELSVEADNANEGNANLAERGGEQPTEKLIQELIEEIESVKRELDSTRREKESLQRKFDFQKRKNELMQRELDQIRQNNMSLSCEVRPSISSVTSTSSRNTRPEFNRKNICPRPERSRHHQVSREMTYRQLEYNEEGNMPKRQRPSY
ncbi:hypothetical protein ACS0PU_011265 [Formica fusca]